MFLLARGGGGYNFNFPLNLPQTLLLVCFFFQGVDVEGGGCCGEGSGAGGGVLWWGSGAE